MVVKEERRRAGERAEWYGEILSVAGEARGLVYRLLGRGQVLQEGSYVRQVAGCGLEDRTAFGGRRSVERCART